VALYSPRRVALKALSAYREVSAEDTRRAALRLAVAEALYDRQARRAARYLGPLASPADVARHRAILARATEAYFRRVPPAYR
jgi:hypothetical protein